MLYYVIVGPGEQAVVHPRQDDGASLREGEDQGIRHGQVPEGASFLILIVFHNYYIPVLYFSLSEELVFWRASFCFTTTTVQYTQVF